MDKRSFIKFGFCAGLLNALQASGAAEIQQFDIGKARSGYITRVAKIKRDGMLPIIDIESSYNPLEIDLNSFTRAMDRAGIAQMCLSVDQPGSLVKEGQTWSQDSLVAYQKYPSHFIPTGNGGNHPAWTKDPDRFLADNEKYIVEQR